MSRKIQLLLAAFVCVFGWSLLSKAGKAYQFLPLPTDKQVQALDDEIVKKDYQEAAGEGLDNLISLVDKRCKENINERIPFAKSYKCGVDRDSFTRLLWTAASKPEMLVKRYYNTREAVERSSRYGTCDGIYRSFETILAFCQRFKSCAEEFSTKVKGLNCSIVPGDSAPDDSFEVTLKNGGILTVTAWEGPTHRHMGGGTGIARQMIKIKDLPAFKKAIDADGGITGGVTEFP